MPAPFGWEILSTDCISPLVAEEIQVYAIRLDPDARWNLHAAELLDKTERARAARFRFGEDRFRFQKTRSALRLILAKHLGVPPAEIAFREGPHGKPYLDHGAGPNIQFNVSHTRGAAVVAVGGDLELGVDIEHARRKVDTLGVGRKVFTPAERASVASLGAGSALRQFFRLWTAKEAYLKATGSGLSCDPATIEAELDRGTYRSADGAGGQLPYLFQELATRNGFIITLAQERRKPQAVCLAELD